MTNRSATELNFFNFFPFHWRLRFCIAKIKKIEQPSVFLFFLKNTEREKKVQWENNTRVCDERMSLVFQLCCDFLVDHHDIRASERKKWSLQVEIFWVVYMSRICHINCFKKSIFFILKKSRTIRFLIT